MRSSITLFEDQYQFFMELKSKKLLVAFVQFMFEDIEPKNLSWIEKTVFNSMRKRMENSKKIHDRNSKGWSSSHGGWRRGNASSELDQKNSLTTAYKTTKKQPKNKEEEEEDILLSKDNNVDESTEQKNENEILYDAYPFKDKWIDKQVCDKLITKQFNQWATLEWMLKEMKLELLEMRIKQWTSHRYWRKLETWLREYVEWMADSEDRLRELLVMHRKRLENWPSYRKNPRDELCELFWKDCVNKLFMETKQWIKLFTT